MGRQPKLAAAPSRMIPRALAHFRASGVELAPILAALGLPKDWEKRDELSVSPSDFERLIEYVVRALDEPCVALHLPAALDWESYHAVELAAHSSPDLRAAFEQIVRYSSLLYAYLVFSLEETPGELVIRHRLQSGRAGRRGSEYALAATLFYARRYTGVPLVPTRVWFAHADASDRAELRRFFGTRDLTFGRPDNGIAFSTVDARRPTSRRDARLQKTAELLAEAELRERPPPTDFLGHARTALGRMLSDSPSAGRLARRLKMSTRTLQRRLEERGTTFSRLVDAAREEQATQLLGDPALSAAEVAYRLGFTDPAAFTRAFKRWQGLTPSAFRKRKTSR